MNRNLFILLSCLFVVMTGYGISLSVLPFHIERMALAEGITAEASLVHVGLITGLFALMQFFLRHCGANYRIESDDGLFL
jgi:MFS transporter, DHA1 family, multidrug resistance protein